VTRSGLIGKGDMQRLTEPRSEIKSLPSGLNDFPADRWGVAGGVAAA